MFRFTIRDVLWLTVVIASALGWWLDHRATANADISKLLQTMAQEIESCKELIAIYEKERAELRALNVDRKL